jgi:hypothetical protein
MCRDSGWEDEAPAEPKTTASSEWRIVNGKWRLAISDWWMTFLEGSAFALPKT